MASSYTAPQNLSSALLDVENASEALRSAWGEANIKLETADQVSERLSEAYDSPIFHHIHPEMDIYFHDWHYFHRPEAEMISDDLIFEIHHALDNSRNSLQQFFEPADTGIISDAVNNLHSINYLDLHMPHMVDPIRWELETDDYRYRLDQAEKIISEFSVEFDDLNIDPLFQDINQNPTSIEYSTPAFNAVRDEIDSARDSLEQSLSLINDKPEHFFNFQHDVAYEAMASLDLFGEINIALNPDFEDQITAQIDQSKNDIRFSTERYNDQMDMFSPEWHFLNYSPVGDEMHYAANEVYNISTVINEGYASLVALDDSLVDYNSALRDLADLNEDAPETTDGPASIGFGYELLDDNGDYLTQLSVLGDDVSYSSEFTLEIDAKSFEDDYALESADITLKFNPDLFDWIDESDISIGNSLPIANAVKIDNDLGTIRIAAASLSDLSEPGTGSAITATAPLASISLNFDEAKIQLLDKNDDGSLKINPLDFQITANEEETVFSKSIDDGTGFLNREISSLAQLGGSVHVEGQDVTLYEAKINLAQQDDGLVLSTERVIGADATTTNLVRSGDTLTTSTSWLNVGNIEANNLSYEAILNDNASLAYAEFSETNLLSGSFIDGEFVEDARESTVLTTDIHITGQAGSVVDLSDGIISIKADAEGSESFSNAGKGSSNLITFQGDLNYDGRVSMKDLAYLNAGAARQELIYDADDVSVQVASEDSYARDVDADFSGKIDLADLSILDADWGKSLHTGDMDFQGSGEISWEELDGQGENSDWDNTSFKDQNAIEAENSYVGSLEGPGASGVVGSEGIEDGSNSLEGEYFQDFV
jgi:hypothetical protein